MDFEPYLKGLYSATLQELICQEIDDYLTAFPVPLSGSRRGSAFPLESSKKLLDQYFEREKHKMREQIYKILDAKRHRIIDKIKGLSALLSKVEEADKWSHYGTLLISYAHKVKDRAPFVCLKSWDERYGRVEIKLDPRLSPIENAKKYFKLAKKYQRNEEKLLKEMGELKNALNELDEYREFVSMLNDVSDVKRILDDLSSDVRGDGGRKRGDYVPPYKRFDLKDGFIVYVGLNAKGNRYVTFKIASPEDLWFHAKEVAGAHVILKLSGKPTNEKLIDFAASLAAYYSKAKEASYHVVDYTQRKHVKALPKAGPGHVTYSDFSSTRVSPGLWLELLEELQ